MVFGRTKKDAKEKIRKQWVKCCKYNLFKPKGLGKCETISRKEDCEWEATLIQL